MVKVAVVGCGSHARMSVWPALRAADVGVEAVVARTNESARRGADFHGSRGAFTSVGKMLASADIDGVVVVVPPAAYAEVLVPCLETGIPVLCDKPGAANAAECERLAALARGGGSSVVVGYQKRFAPVYRRARSLMRDSGFGSTSLASLRWLMGSFGTATRADWLLENAVHPLDLARWMFGELSAPAVRVASTPDQHALVATATSDSGAVVDFRLGTVGSWFHNNETVEIWGVGSSIVCDNMDTVRLRSPEPPEQLWRPNYTVPMAANSSAVGMGFQPTVEHFVQVVSGEATSESDLDSATSTLRLAEEIVELAAEATSGDSGSPAENLR